MRVSRQKAHKTERRVIVTLDRHERQTTATEIIKRVNRSKQFGDSAREQGAMVYYKKFQDKPAEFLYFIRPEQLVAKPSGLQLKPGVSVLAPGNISSMYEQVKANR